MATALAADALVDRLVNNMGFERYEAQAAIMPAQTAFPLPDDGTQRPLLPVESVIPLPVRRRRRSRSLRDSIEIRPTSTGATVIVRGELTAEVEDFCLRGASQASSNRRCKT
jgi:type III restriction enzyme